MPLLDFLTPEAVVASLRVSGKKQALQELAAHAARLTGLDERVVFEALLQRERLGSTGIGEGLAIPHGKLPKLGRLFGPRKAPGPTTSRPWPASPESCASPARSSASARPGTRTPSSRS